MWKDVAVCPSVFFTWWLMLNIIYIQPLQESKDDISNQPCMTAYLSFVTIFNTIYQRKTGFQKKTFPLLRMQENSKMPYIHKMCGFETQRWFGSDILREGLYLATLNHVDIFTIPHTPSLNPGLLNKLFQLLETWLSQFLPSRLSILTTASGTR